MAPPTLPNSPPLTFAEILLNGVLARFPHPTDELVICDYRDDWCDCTARATVHLIETEEDLCLRHFAVRLKEENYV